MIEIDSDLKDIVISALRYAIGRRTYITGETTNFIINHSELIDERVKTIMIKDLEEYFDLRHSKFYNDDDCDYQNWIKLYKHLLKH